MTSRENDLYVGGIYHVLLNVCIKPFAQKTFAQVVQIITKQDTRVTNGALT